MKILMIVTWYGEKNNDKFTGNFHTDMARAINKSNDVAIYFPYDSKIDTPFEYGYEDGILVFRGKVFGNISTRLKRIKKDFEIIRSVFSPDLLHAHVTSGAGETAMIINRLYKMPYVITEHCPIEMMRLGFKSKQKYGLILKYSAKNMAVSPNLNERLNGVFRRAKFVYVNNGVIDPYKIMQESDDDYKKPNAVNCVLVGALYDKNIKGLQYLLPAVKKVLSSGKQLHLHICGDGEYLPYYKKMAQELGIENSITFYGMLEKPKLFNIVNQMDFNISASLFESAGVAVEEACLLGKPAVITNSGGADSLMPDQFSIKVEKGSVEALYDGIMKMIESYRSYNGEEIREYGLREFEMNNVCKQLIDIYKSALDK